MVETLPKDLNTVRRLINELRPLTVHKPWKGTGIAEKKTSKPVGRKCSSSKKTVEATGMSETSPLPSSKP